MMKYRLTQDDLIKELEGWNSFLKRKISLIACGGTALTLLGVKPSTKDVDFMVPRAEDYSYLRKCLLDLGYKSARGNGITRDGVFIFDLFCGNKIHTTELLNSPLDEDCNIFYDELTYIYVGILNFYDLITSKLFRGTDIDFDDCRMLFRAKYDEIDINTLEKRFRETAAYDVSEDKVLKNMESFLKLIEKE